MGWSFKIGTIGGTAVRVHITFALLLVWIWLAYYRIGGAPAAWEGIASFSPSCVLLTLTNYGPPSHNIKFLRSLAEEQDRRLIEAFPRDQHKERA